MIKIKNVFKKFKSDGHGTDALKNINLEIKKGEFIALIGPSGSGKSTLLNLIGGLELPSKGEILISNKKISSYNDKKLSEYRNHDLGFIFQEFHLEPFLSVKENILLPTYFSDKKSAKNALADKLIAEVGLKNKSTALAKEISGGQKQRTAIARALINSPKLILADEPTGNLDQKTGQSIIQLLKKLHKTHKATLIIASHDPAIAKAAKRIIHIKDGELC